MKNKQIWGKLVFLYEDTKRLYIFLRAMIILLLLSIIFFLFINNLINKISLDYKNLLYGRWDEVFLNVNKQDFSYFKEHAFINDVATQEIKEYKVVNKFKSIVVGSCSDNFLEVGNITLIKGNLPKKDNEIAIEKEYMSILGIQDVGDIISNNVNIKSIRGLKVCGIVENYSNRWSMINRNVKYINCFIFKSDSDKLNIFVSCDNSIRNDIEINVLQYNLNIHPNTNTSINSFVFIWIIIIVYILIIYLKINQVIKKRILLYKAENNSKIKYFFKKKIVKHIVVLLLSSFTIVTLYKLIDNVLLLNQSILDKNIQTIPENILDLNYISMDKEYNAFIEECNYNISNKTTRYFLNQNLSFIIDLLGYLMLLILLNWIIIEYMISSILTEISENYECQLKYYYFYKKFFIRSKRNKIIFYLILENIIISSFIFIKEYDSQGKLIVLYMILYLSFFNLVRLIINFIVIKTKMRYIEMSLDDLVIIE